MSVNTLVNGAAAPTTTFTDGPGNPNQGSLVWAISAGCWWYFQINSALDATGNPGTHKVSAWYNLSGDPGAGKWIYSGNGPNIDSDGVNHGGSNANVAFRNGRSMGAYYWNNPTGTNKDILHMAAGTYPASGVPNDANAFMGNGRLLLGRGTLVWGTWGYYICNSFNYASATVINAVAFGRGTTGYMHIGSAIMTDQLDVGVMVSQDPDTGDTWATGGRGTGTQTGAASTVTAMSTQAGLAVGYALKGANLAENTPNTTNKVNSIDSGTQVTMVNAWAAGTQTGADIAWTNFTPGTRFTNVVDGSMTFECNAVGFATLPNTAMLVVYDDGANHAPSMTNLGSTKSSASGTIANGFWPTNNGAPDATVFGTALAGTTQSQNNDWNVCSLSTDRIYTAGRRNETVIDVRVYQPPTNNWGALVNNPPVMTGKAIKAGGGVCLQPDPNGLDMHLVVIDGTDNQIKYAKYSRGTSPTNGTWDAGWTNLVAVGSTAAFLTATTGNGYLAFAWSEQNSNGTNYDTKMASLSLGPQAGDPATSPARVGRA